MASWRELPSEASLLATDEFKQTSRGTPTTMSCTERWEVPSGRLEDFLRVMLGTPEDIGAGLVRIVPLRARRFPWCIMESWDEEQIGRPDGDCNTESSIITIRFAMPDWDAEQRSIQVGPDSREMRRPAASAKGESDEPIPGQRFSVTLHNLESLPYATWVQYGGYLNSDTWNGIAPGFAMFEPPEAAETINWSGQRKGSATCTVRASRVHWNDEWGPGGTLVRVGAKPSVDFRATLGI